MPPVIQKELDNWQLDKRINIPGVAMFLVWVVAAIWSMSALYKDVASMDRRITHLEITNARTAEILSQMNGTLSSIHATQTAMQHSQTRIERQIDAARTRPNQ